jgi:methionyl aminopeptidase
MPKPLHPKIYSKNQIKKIKEAAQIVSQVLKVMEEKCKVGVTTLEVDEVARDFLKSCNAQSACYGYKGFPRYSCISIDNIVLHGIPDHTPLKEGMLVGIDCPVKYKGMFADAAINVEIGEVDESKKKLNEVSYNCLMETIKIIKPGVTIGEICKHQFMYATQHGFDVVKQFRGHGVGRALHEPPGIPYFYDPNNIYNNYKLKPGNIIAIEPTLVTNDNLIKLDNGWAYVTEDQSSGASWEHTILVVEEGYEILTK